jgi:hypothetical protein
MTCHRHGGACPRCADQHVCTHPAGAFAVVWNGFVAFWTVSALASGGVLFALFSAPFWFAGDGPVSPPAAGMQPCYTCQPWQACQTSFGGGVHTHTLTTTHVAGMRMHTRRLAAGGAGVRRRPDARALCGGQEKVQAVAGGCTDGVSAVGASKRPRKQRVCSLSWPAGNPVCLQPALPPMHTRTHFLCSHVHAVCSLCPSPSPDPSAPPPPLPFPPLRPGLPSPPPPPSPAAGAGIAEGRGSQVPGAECTRVGGQLRGPQRRAPGDHHDCQWRAQDGD